MRTTTSALAATAALALLAACGSGSGHSFSPTPGVPAGPRCANGVVPTVLPDGWVEDLGTLAVGADASFTVTAGTASFYIVAQEVGTTAVASIAFGGTTVPNSVVPTNLRSPASTLYYDDLASFPTTTIAGQTYPDTTGLLAFDPGFQPVTAVLPFPSTGGGLQKLRGAGEVEQGTWHFTVNDWALECLAVGGCTGGSTSGRYRIGVVKRPGAINAAGTLDVEVYLATGATSVLPSAATANAALLNPTSQVSRWRQSLAAFLGNAGISVGTVTFHDVPAAAKAQYAPNGQVNLTSSEDPCGPVSQLFTSSGIAPRRAVHVFLADVLVAPAVSGNIQVAGLDGAIPGPSGYPGTITSGAIVGLEDWGAGTCSGGAPSLGTCGTDRTAYVTAHEIGHWLGLFHTTEQDGTFFDPLLDTAPCPCHLCAAAAQQAACAEVATNPTTLVTNDRCVASASCGGGRNLMFWLLDGRYSTGELSADQGQVMRLNPAVQ